MKQFGTRLALAALSGWLVAGCTVQPLYAPAAGPGIAQTAPLASIYIEPVGNRAGLELRNALIFLLNGGSGQPADAAYTLALNVETVSANALIVQIKTQGEPTSKRVTVSAAYELTRSSDDTPIAKRRASATASYDVSLQEFANNRAERDAETRAARELAEQFRALITADLSRMGAR